ncbi:MAG: homogentisate 1,2-dioxygenase [Acidimicrobiia bacterium]
MTYYRQVGELPKKRHSQFRSDDGRLFPEELVGERGFFHASSLLYHRHQSNILLAAEAVDVPALRPVKVPNSPLAPRHLQTRDVSAGGDAVTGRHCLLLNDDVRVSFVVADAPSPLFKNAVGDELVFVKDGDAVLESQYGVLTADTGDYVRVPMGTVHRWLPGTRGAHLLVLEATGHVEIPNRYLSPRGQFLEHAPYCERDFRAPSAPLVVDDEPDVEVLVKHHDGVTLHTLAHHPFDVIGWDGTVYPWAFSIYDYEPVVKRFHMPPIALETFSGPNFSVCSFTPRPADFDPTSVPAPYAHAALDCDEVMFFASGDYTIRRGTKVGVGSITFHPSGWTHSPHPGGSEASIGKPAHEEYAVMVDTFRPLSLGPAAAAVEDHTYLRSWAEHPNRIR